MHRLAKAALPSIAAAIVAGAMLAVPFSSASWSHDDCTQNRIRIKDSRLYRAQTMMYLNRFLAHAQHHYAQAMEDIMANAGDEAIVNLLAADATKKIVWDLEMLNKHLDNHDRLIYIRDLRRCPALFGRNVAEVHRARRSAAANAVELRDLLDEAVAMYADNEGESE